MDESDKTREQLVESERLYRLLADNVTDIIWTLDMNLRFTYVSPSVSRLLGFSTEEFMSRSLDEIMTPDSLEAVMKIFEEEQEIERSDEQADPGRSRKVESKVFCQDGTTILAETNATFLRDGDNQPVGILGVTRDITERREAEERIRHLAMIAEQAAEGVAWADLDGMLQFVNPAFAKMHGYQSGDELVGKPLSVFHNDEQMKTDVIPFNETVKRNGRHTGEVGHVRKDGSVFPAEMAVTLFKDKQGTPIGLNAFMTDISDRRRIEGQLLESEEKYRSLFENAQVGMFRTMLDGSKILALNEKACEMSDYSREELLAGSPLLMWANPDEREEMKRRIMEKGHVKDFEAHIVAKKSNEVMTALLSIKLFPETEILEGSVVDITERKRAEEALRESEAKWRSLVENAPDIIITLDRDGKILFVNHTVTGRTQEQVVGSSVFDFVLPEHHLTVEKSIGRVFRTGEADRYELVGDGPSGRASWYETRVGPIKSAGKVTNVMLISTDITERKLAEEAIERRLVFEKTVSNVSSRFVVVSDIDRAITDSLEEMGRLSGASRAYLFLLHEDGIAMDNTHEWCAEGVAPQIENLQNLPAETVPWWMKKLRKGEVIHIKDVSGMPAEAKAEKEILESQDIKSLIVLPLKVEGDLAGFIGFDDVVETRGWSDDDLRVLRISSNIIGNAIDRERAHYELERRVRERTSELEEANRALRRSEAICTEAQRIAKLGNWEWNIQTDEMTWSDEVCRILKATPQQLGTTYDAFLDSVGPEDQEPIKKAVGLAWKDRKPYGVDHRIVLPDGTTRVVHQQGEVTFNEAGQPARMFGVVQDITERKRMEEDLARLAAATESAADGIAITDPEGNIQYINPAFERITGFSREECIGRNVEVCSGEGQERFRREVMDTLMRDGVWRGRLTRKKKDGSTYQEERSITAVRGNSGEVANYAHIIRDVTEKLRLESIAEAVNTMSNIGYIFSGIRHEVGNPINSIGTVLKILKTNLDKYDRQAINTYIERALAEISTVEVLLNNLKSFNMYENPELGDVNLPAFVDKFLTLVKTDSENRGVAVTAAVAPDAESCRADPRALQQVLMNVFTNALDACGERDDPQISIDVSKQLGMILINVVDNGCGMNTAQRENLFKPFYTGKSNGTGLGLVIARKMLVKMNASVEVTSEKDVGTTVSIYFPEVQSGN